MITRLRKTTDKGNGDYTLAWTDELGAVLCSMDIHISGDDAEETIDANYRLMKKNNKELFIEIESTEGSYDL